MAGRQGIKQSLKEILLFTFKWVEEKDTYIHIHIFIYIQYLWNKHKKLILPFAFKENSKLETRMDRKVSLYILLNS